VLKKILKALHYKHTGNWQHRPGHWRDIRSVVHQRKLAPYRK
jgi:hypothetical protein